MMYYVIDLETGEIVDKGANGQFMEAIARRHIKETGHDCVVGMIYTIEDC